MNDTVKEMTEDELRTAVMKMARKLRKSYWLCCDCPHKGLCSESNEECEKHIILWAAGKEKGQP